MISRDGPKEKAEIDKIRQYLDEDDEILVLGNNSYYYIYLDKYPEFKYFFQMPIIFYDDNIAEETKKYVYNNKPKVIVNEVSSSIEIIKKIYGEELVNIIDENYEEHKNIIDYYVYKEN